MTRVVTPAEWRAQPWKNGGGTTREVLRWPEDDAYDVRVSLADVTRAGPFSRFPGYRRWTCFAGGSAIELSAAGRVHRLAALGDLVELDGDAGVDAALEGEATRLLNVIARPGTEVGAGLPGRAVRFVFALSTTPELPRWHALVLEPPARFDRRAIVWIR